VTAIQALTYQDGGVPIYHHHMLVDSSPRAADIDFNNGVGTPPDGSSWHTIVVGGLGKGGTSYYALDLTGDLTALVTDEVSAASRVMWEWFNPDSDVPLPGSRLVTGGYPGFTYGHPVIVKVREDPVLFPTGRWVVVVTGGYNNLSGVGKVYFLDARTGQLLSTITTSGATAGGPGTPAGLAQIHGFVRNQHDQTIEQIYGGDLFGNVWRIDVSARSNPKAAPDYLANVYNGLGAKAAPVVLFAQLTDPLGVGQPVTTAPQIEIDFNNGIDRYVFVGTGRLLHPDDLTLPATPQQQTYYAIRDGTLTTVTPNAGLLPIQPRATMVSVATLDTAAIAGGAPNGWYQDLPNNPGDPILGSQRIVVDPQSQANIASYIGTKVQDDVCQLSLPAFLYARDYTSASSLLETAPNTFAPYMALQIMDASGNLIDLGGVGLQLVGRIQVDGSMSLGALTSGEIPGTKPYDIKNPVTGPGLRWSWRLLTGE